MTTSAVLCSILRLYVAASAHGPVEVFAEVVHHQPAALVEEELVAIRIGLKRLCDEGVADLDHHLDVPQQFRAWVDLILFDEELAYGARQHGLVAHSGAEALVRDGIPQADLPEARFVPEEVCVAGDGRDDRVLPF